MDGKRFFDIYADVVPGLIETLDSDGVIMAVVSITERGGSPYTAILIGADKRIAVIAALLTAKPNILLPSLH